MVTLAATLIVLYLLFCTPLGELLWVFAKIAGMFALILAIPVGTMAVALWLMALR